jgi:hypothetical protein
MPEQKGGRKEPTTTFTVRMPVSLEAGAYEAGEKNEGSRNAFIVAAVAEKLARDKRKKRTTIAA